MERYTRKIKYPYSNRIEKRLPIRKIPGKKLNK